MRCTGRRWSAPNAKLLSKADAAAMRFLETELQTGLSFARMAAGTSRGKKARPGDAQKTKRYLAHARTAHGAVASRIGTLRVGPEELREIELKFSELRKLLGPDENV